MSDRTLELQTAYDKACDAESEAWNAYINGVEVLWVAYNKATKARIEARAAYLSECEAKRITGEPQ